MTAINYEGREFRAIPGRDGYFVSDRGEVLSTAKWHGTNLRLLALNIVGRGYLAATACGRKFYAHRAVASAWVPNPDGLSEVNHKDGNKANNSAGNLEWVSSSGNKLHAHRTGLNRGRGHPVVGVHIETGRKVYFKSRRAANAAGFSHNAICGCISGKAKTHHGYMWSNA